MPKAPNAVKFSFSAVLAQPSATARNAVKLRFLRSRRYPLRTSRASKARNSGKVAFSAVGARPCADIVRVEAAECR